MNRQSRKVELTNDDVVIDHGPRWMDSSMISELTPETKRDEVQPPVVPDDVAVDTRQDDWKRRLEAKLCGRQKEEVLLVTRFRALLSCNRTELMLITGPPGSGMTRLAHCLKEPVEQMGGYFVTGVCDPLQRTLPYPVWVTAFTEYASLVRRRGQMERIRQVVFEAIGPDAQGLTRMIPALEKLLGPNQKASDAGSRGPANQRFAFVFRDFLRAICSVHPLVLHLDGLHWADPCSLDMLACMLTEQKIPGLVVVGTCAAGMPSKSYLSLILREIERSQDSDITHVQTENLSADEVFEVVSFLFQRDDRRSRALGAIVSNHTGGNWFEITEFLRRLQETDELLFFDGSLWQWDVDEIALAVSSRPHADALSETLRELPTAGLEVIKVIICLAQSNHIDLKLVELVVSTPIEAFLSLCFRFGLVVPDETVGGLRFRHSRIRTKVYSLIPEDDRGRFHLEIGRRLWRQLNESQLERHLFTVLSQLYAGKGLISRENERIATAKLCLTGATKAAKSSTFRTASSYLEMGISLLGLRCWRDDYDLSLSLHTAGAEMAMLTLNYDRMNELAAIVVEKARSQIDQIPVHASQIYSLSSRGLKGKALQLALKVLADLGEPIPARMSLPRLVFETCLVANLLRGKSDEHFMRLPIMDDKGKLAALQIMNLILVTAIFSTPEAIPFVILRMMKLTVKYGLSVFSSVAFTAYGLFRIAGAPRITAGNATAGYRYGSLGLQFLKRFGGKEFEPRVNALYCHAPQLFSGQPVKECFPLLLEGYRVGMQTGDYEAAALCANFYIIVGFNHGGIPCDKMLQQCAIIRETMIAYGQKSLLRITEPAMMNLGHCHAGVRELSGRIDCRAMVEEYEEYIRAAEESGQPVITLGIRLTQMVMAYEFDDLERADELYAAMQSFRTVPMSFTKFWILWYAGLVSIACARRNIRRRFHSWRAKRIVTAFRRVTPLSPLNLQGLYLVLQAELASWQGQNHRAFQKYAAAMAMARDQGMLFLMAKIERCNAEHFFRIGDRPQARVHFEQAISQYRAWSGHALADHVEAQMQELYSL